MEISIDPSDPLQVLGFVASVTVATSTSGSVIVTVIVLVQPLESVTIPT